MAEFLLVHGSCHGAWCWHWLIPELTALGHTARAIDLPSHGADPTPIADVTLDLCCDAVLAAARPERVIVGHSWGGFPISAAAEAAPDAMRGLIYLSAYVPLPGMSMTEMRQRCKRQPAMNASVSSPDGLSYSVDPAQARPLFYHDCPDECVDYALPRLCPQPIRPQQTPLPLSDRFASVPKAYIRTTDDQTVPTEFQAEMSAKIPSNRQSCIDSSHSSFFSHPRQLAAILDRIEGEFP